MPYEHETPRPVGPAPRGCLAALVVMVVLALAALVLLALAWQPRFPGAEPF